MKTNVTFSIKFLSILITVFCLFIVKDELKAQYVMSYYQDAGNPGNINTEIDNSVTGWTSIGILGTTNVWSATQTIPFSFQFYGSAVTGFKASMNGLLTFTTSVTGTPPNANSPLPSLGLPNNTIACFWDEFASNPPGQTGGGGPGGQVNIDQILVKTFGNAPNRQLWIKWNSMEIGASSDNTNASFACVLEESTNKVYIIDYDYITLNMTYSMTVGLQQNLTTYIQDTLSPNINLTYSATTTATANNDYWAFSPPIPMTYDTTFLTQITQDATVGVANQEILKIEVKTNGNTTPLTLTGFNFNNSGTTDYTDVLNAKVYYTGVSGIFTPTSQFGNTVISPNGNFTITGSQTLQQGSNYFWLAYDVSPAATTDNYLDAELSTLTVNSVSHSPDVNAPNGARQLKNQVIVGNGNLTNTNQTYPAPYGNYYWGARHQFLVTASELSAAGVSPGQILSLGFNVVTAQNTALTNFEIKMGNTNQASLTGFLSNLTSVYTNSSYMNTTGWNIHQFQTPFIWDGTSNVVIETCFDNNSYTFNSVFRLSSTPFTSTVYYRNDANNVCTLNTITGTDTLRPIMKFGLPPVPHFDAGVTMVNEPIGSVTTGVKPVKVTVKNYGSVTMTKVTIKYKVDGVLKSPYIWTGSLAYNATSSQITIGNITISSGPHNIIAWTEMPNDSADILNLNDTAYGSCMACSGTLSGTYTIGGTSANYSSFSDAVTAINYCGISGPVTFNVAPGTYLEQFTLLQIPNSSSSNIITFKSANNDSSSVILTYSPTSAATNFIVNLSGADYVKFSKITILNTNATYGRCVQISDSANYITFLNCRIAGLSTTSTATEQALVFSPSTGTNRDNYLTFSNNLFENGVYGLCLYGPATSYESGLLVDGNHFRNQSNRGIFVYNQTNPTIKNNTISTTSSSATYRGIYVYAFKSGIQVSKNKVSAQTGGSALYLYGGSGNALSTGNIVNNFFHVNATTGTTGENNGIVIDNSTNLTIYYNSVNVTGNNQTSRALSLVTGADTLQFKDNLLINSASGFSFYSQVQTSAFTSNYNDLYTSGANLGFLQTNRNNLNAWKLASQGDANSVSVNPVYNTASDLHVTSQSVNNLGTPISGITADIDGETRNTTTPDIGADEFTIYTVDIGATELTSPVAEGCLSSAETVTVRIKNFGTASINLATTPAVLHVSVTGPNPTTFPNVTLNAGYFTPGSTADITISSSYNMSQMGSYIFSAYTTLTGDSNTTNNAMNPATVTNTVISTYPFFENMENFTVGVPGIVTHGWSRSSSGSYNWYVDNNGTPSNGTGPMVDHTIGNNTGKYLYAEASSPATLGQIAYFTSPCINLSAFPKPIVSFWYHMFGSGIGSLSLDLYNNGTWINDLVTLTGAQQMSQNSPYLQATADLTGYSGYSMIRFRAVRNDSLGDIAIDDILISSYPNVTLGADTNICSGSTYSLNAGSGTGYTYEWHQMGSIAVIGTSQTLPVSNAGTYFVKVTDAFGLTGNDTINIGINPLPSVSFSGLPANSCINASTISLSGSPSGGVFSGTGVSGTSFNPAIAGAGSQLITYTYTGANGCSNSQTQTILVHALPTVSFTGISSTVCLGFQTYTLTGNPSGGTFSGDGITGNTFSPINAGVGTHTITYMSPPDTWGCSNSQVQTVTVLTPPSVSYSGLALLYCAGASPVTLVGSPAGGVFTGTGISGNVFSPTIAGVGTHNISYSYTGTNGCNATASQSTVVNANPVANAGTDFNINYGTSTTLTGSASGTGPFAFSWSPVNLLVNPALQNPTTVTLTSTSVFTLNVTNTTTSCQNSDQVQVTIIGGALTANTTATPTTICAGDSSHLNALGSGGTGTFTYSWTSNPAGFTSTSQNPVVTPTATTIYTVQINDGLTTSSSSVTVNVNPKPSVSLSGLNSMYCSSDSASAVTVNPVGGTLSGPGIIGNMFNPSIIANGNVQVMYSYTNTYGCTNSTIVPVQVNQSPVSNAGQDNIISCGSTGVQIGSASQTGLNYSWSPSAGLSSSAVSNPVAAPLVTTLYTVTTTNAASGCSSTDEVLISVSGGPAAFAGNDTIICKGDQLLLTASGGTGYAWNTGLFTQSIVVSPVAQTTYIVTVSQGNCFAADTVVVKVSSPQVNLSAPDTLHSNPYVLDAGAGFTSYKWQDNSTTQTYLIIPTNYPNPSYQTFYVTVTDSVGCTASDTIVVFIFYEGIQENLAFDLLQVYPNPSNGIFNLEIENSQKEDIETCLYNLQGQLINCQKNSVVASKNRVKLDYSTLPKGIYFLKVSSEGKLETRKLVIQ